MDYDSTGIEYYDVPFFTFVSGPTIPIKVAYRRFNTGASQTVLIPTCFGGRINTTLNFTQGSLASYHVVVVAMLGNGESSSPSNTPNFPDLEYRDVINAHYELLTEGLKIKSLEAVVGFSMGGQQAYHWATCHPEFVKRAVVICGSARTSDHNYAFLEGPKAALVNSTDYCEGKYREKGVEPKNSVRAFGRAYLAWMFSQAWFRAKLWKQTTGANSMAEFMDVGGSERFSSWDPQNLLVLLHMWQKGDIGVYRDDGDYQKALADIKIKILLMPCRTDQYFPPEDNEDEMKFLKFGELLVIESVWGHVMGGGQNPADTLTMDQNIGRFISA